MSTDVLSNAVGVKTRHLCPLDSMALNRAIVLKADQLLEDIREPLPHISLNMVVCLNNKDHSQEARWLINSLQANSPVSKVDTVDRQLNPLLNIQISKWATVLLPVLADTDVVLNPPQPLNGVLLPTKALEMVLVATKVKSHNLLPFLGFGIPMYLLVDFARSLWGKMGYQLGWPNPLSASALMFLAEFSLKRLARPAWNLHRALSILRYSFRFVVSMFLSVLEG